MKKLIKAGLLALPLILSAQVNAGNSQTDAKKSTINQNITGIISNISFVRAESNKSNTKQTNQQDFGGGVVFPPG
jgi:hypothetical protein